MAQLTDPITGKDLSSEKLKAPHNWLLQFQSCFPPNSRPSIVLGRLAWGRSLKHMRNTQSQFSMTPGDKLDTWKLYWKNEHLATTLPYPQPQSFDELNIITTGPSLLSVDFESLKGMTNLGVNGSIALLEKHGIRPEFYVITDLDFFENRMDLVTKALESGAHCFFSFTGIARLLQFSPGLAQSSKISLIQTVNRYYGIPQKTPSELQVALKEHPYLHIASGGNSKIGWSSDPRKGIFTGNTIAFIACQLAAFMTRRSVKIFGMDLGGNDKEPTRAYDEQNQPRPTTLGKDYTTTILPAFTHMKLVHGGCKFHNCSTYSRLPDSVIPKIS